MSFLSVVEVACHETNGRRELKCHLQGMDGRWSETEVDIAGLDGDTRITRRDTRVEFDEQKKCHVDDSEMLHVLECEEY